ncbi:endospore germination permease [Tissierella sp. Yu-01]|uniref:GerAB/ArcD/ProY family transporter n=1 Tax=Tissierella sp. Yu-01 TaxID=3035694 RepID=UPI00240D5DC6|nr:endospore germination permease [Tissierella sp. Yu-01]WFA08516.1 endospore germination permease [Tissierella sp. Yu-01]
MDKPKISHIHIRGIIVSTSVGVGVLSMPGALGELMGNDGWIAIILAGLLLIPFMAIYDRIFSLYPDKDFFEIGKETMGTFIFTIFLFIFLAYLVLTLGIISRTLAELIKIYLLQTTPLEVIMLIFILASTYIACYEIDVIARASYFLYPIIILFALIIVLISLPNADFTRLLPVFDIDFISTVKGVKETFFSFLGFEIILLAIPFVEDKEKVFKSQLIGAFTITVIYLALFIMTISHFSLKQIEIIVYPILMLIRQLDLPWFFLENLDGLVMALWVIVVFSTMAPFYYGSGKILSKIFRTKKHKYFIWGLIPVIYYIGILPKNFIELIEDMGRYFNILAVISAIIIPIIILISASIRKKVLKR